MLRSALTLFAFLVLLGLTLLRASAGPITDVTPLGAHSLLTSDKRVMVLDIRTPGEFRAGHIKGAVNIDFYARNFRARLAKLDRNVTYLMHCKRGGRSDASVKVFKDLGFKRVIHMPAGMDGWKRAGLPIARP